MDIAVGDAARRLGISEPRVRQLLGDGALRGRRLGRAWLVDSDDVARLQGHRRRPGRPPGPRRAWSVVDLLRGGAAPWLSASERSQVRSQLVRAGERDADGWRSILRGRNELRPVRAHPAAVARLGELGDALESGPAEAMRRGFDLVVVGDPRPEFYLPDSRWNEVARALALQAGEEGDVLLRHPIAVWPFEDRDAVCDAALAADLLDSPEPRAVRAGRLRLNELLEDFVRRSG